jgi:hypothetical protein
MIMDSFHIHILDPTASLFSRGADDSIELRINDQFYPKVWVFRSYPLSNKEQFLSLRDATRQDLPEIGLIYDLKQFPAETQEMIGSELEKRYFVPRITEVVSLKEARDRLEWDVVTTKGRRHFTIRNPFDNIRSLEDGRLLITDTHNCRYEIQDHDALPNKLKDILSKYIYL